MKIKDTLNLPRTDFAMRARLPERETEIQARWEADGLYQQMQTARREAPVYLLHDGPPYANGHLHLGTALNKILKDIVVRYHNLRGERAPFVPGWDCHGMPIEQQVVRQMGDRAGQAEVLEIRGRCREYAAKWVEIQDREFRRLGSIGDYGNPYLTTQPAYEAEILRAFRDLVAADYITKGLRSIHWCLTCQTALAEAELEYAPHHSPSIYVGMQLVADEQAAGMLAADLPPDTALEDVRVLIWTTTPWTIPANLAIAVHPEFDYVLASAPRPGRQNGMLILLAEELVNSTMAAIGVDAGTIEILARFKGSALEGLRTRHPLYDRDSPLILAEHVTLEQGTGAVHTAPGHGQEDFEIGKAYGLDVLCPVDEAGIFDADAGPFEGIQVFEANPVIVKAMEDAGALLGHQDVEHSYPHCWRCKTPLIYRATEQWFLDVDHRDLRRKLLRNIDTAVRWIPEWGAGRISSMVEGRPDWCLSRQRSWGVPIPALYCTDCGQLHLDVAVIDRAVEIVASEGSDAWFRRPVSDFLPAGTVCNSCGGDRFERERDIFDVWFESGVSHRAVLASGRWPDLRWPADVYLEGHDQHRGWFQVSLITAVAADGKPPYGVVVTHGHVLDEQGRKMSKSLGNVITPKEVVEQYGADILRLYFASVDYTHDLPFSVALIEPVVESYRKIRNTIRFLLGNLQDFEPRDAVDDDRLQPFDRWVLHCAAQLGEQIGVEYDDFRFHRVVHRLHHFASVTLSSVYLDIVKDRLYISAPDDPARRAAQTTIYRLVDALTRWLAPVLPHTTEEIWSHLPGTSESSVHLATMPDLSDYLLPNSEAESLQALMSLRDTALNALEHARAAGQIGSGLEAAVVVRETRPQAAAMARRFEAWLAELFIVSQVELLDADATLPDGVLGSSVATADGGLEVAVLAASGQKCERCWTWRRSVGASQSHPSLCSRCTEIVDRLVTNQPQT